MLWMLAELSPSLDTNHDKRCLLEFVDRFKTRRVALFRLIGTVDLTHRGGILLGCRTRMIYAVCFVPRSRIDWVCSSVLLEERRRFHFCTLAVIDVLDQTKRCLGRSQSYLCPMDADSDRRCLWNSSTPFGTLQVVLPHSNVTIDLTPSQ